MRTRHVVAGFVWIAVAVLVCAGPRAASHPDLSGAWTLNREASEFPKEVGFDPNWVSDTAGTTGAAGQGGTTTRSGGSRRGGGGGGTSLRLPAPANHYQSAEDAKNLQQLVSEVKKPPARLTISQTETAFIVTDSSDERRVFHPSGKDEAIPLQAGPVIASTKWDGDALLVRYRVDKDQELRYWFSKDTTSDGPNRLLVRIQLADHNRGETIKRIYDAVR